ncbi:hypothetical protein ACQKTA_04995 [Enterococcus sp. 22-H-5-01]|uniref:hypothetical protein n=1 Tax=Enterococcus sp. 22-H-5-01 TaxID=3418555 RepID=UPI003D02A996
MSDLEIIEKAIRDINGIHRSISEDHFDKKENIINLKKFEIKDCISSEGIDSDFLEYINEYHSKLNLVIAYSDFEYDYASSDGRIRVKQKESIQNKILHYYLTNNNGEIPIQKCLNDMLGFRLTFDCFDPCTDEFINMMTSLKSELTLMKWYNRNKEGYKGTHIYFKNSKNIYFPWELQIWNSSDSKLNELSHSEHKSKRNYINWPRQYKAGRLRKDDE